MYALLFLAAYLIGSIPSGLIVAGFGGRGIDPRQCGSGNIGATNVARVLGRRAGLITLAGDVLKGALPPLVGGWLAAGAAGQPYYMAAAGAGAVLGHVCPVFLRFKGGKGVATAAGVFLVVAPLALLGAAGVFALLVWRWRYVSLGSVGAALALPVGVWAATRSLPFSVLATLIGLLVVSRHHANLARLREGTEHRVGRQGRRPTCGAREPR
ncbi:MAG: glycerol-3-phosphate 1-O-acyltransferase PlsY [Pseudomonadota bacterium]